MADVHTKEVRSYNMSRIPSKDTKPELIVRRFLFANGFRYRLQDKKLPGKPDIVLRKYKTVIFVHGCFWHGHENCKYFVIPKTRTSFWMKKINIQSSLRLNKALTENQRKDAIKIIENILAISPNFFDEVSEVSSTPEAVSNNKIDTDLLTKMVVWDTKAKVLSAKELQYIADFAYGLKRLNDFHEKNIQRYLSKLQQAGFRYK